MEKSTVINIGGTTPNAVDLTGAIINTCMNAQGYDTLTVILETVGATGGTLDLVLESQWGDETEPWYSLYRVPQIASGASAAIYKFSLSLSNTVNAIGKNKDTTSLAVSTPAAGHWGDRVRLVAKAGAGTSAGAAIVCKLILTRILR